jgi:hypothetical protein
VANSHGSWRQDFTTHNFVYFRSRLFLSSDLLSLYLMCNFSICSSVASHTEVIPVFWFTLQSPYSGWKTQKENIQWYIGLALTVRVEVWHVVLSNGQGTMEGIDTNWAGDYGGDWYKLGRQLWRGLIQTGQVTMGGIDTNWAGDYGGDWYNLCRRLWWGLIQTGQASVEGIDTNWSGDFVVDW